ncbi:FecR family protein [Chitinophaga japonensis]|uniref:FecR family protein n=1 Tax=Chitinophaga japonensis TaxID=104662 RepID=A0A562TF31_CHIJA|nr:FecR domain-containing protein [Chitinophaga japonensis]TWI91590.1 FecR family protein [Chitinophaga japonensis]
MAHNRQHIRLMMIERIAGTLAEQDEAVLERLIREDKAVAQQWQELRAVFDTPEAAAEMGRLEERQQRVWRHIDPQRRLAVAPRRRSLITRIAAAAVILAAVAAGALYFLLRPHSSPSLQADVSRQVELRLANGQTINVSGAGHTISLGAAQLQNSNKTLSYKGADSSNAGINELTVPVGMDYKVLLSDGTEVWLNAVTTLRFPFRFTGNTREVTINGEAYLKVAADAQRPFIVHMPHGHVQVLGTAFNVNSYDTGLVKVSLVAGAVRLRADNSTATLQPGQEGVYGTGEAIRVRPFDEKDILGWMQGVQVFYNAPVREISKVLSRWYGIKVQLDDPRLADEKFTGFIERSKPPRVFLEQLKMTTALDYYFDGEVLHLK